MADGPARHLSFMQGSHSSVNPWLLTGNVKEVVLNVNLCKSIFSPGSLFGLDWSKSLALVPLS